jgi:hypothetical protein
MRCAAPAAAARRPAAKLAACRPVAPQLRAAARPKPSLQSRARFVAVRAEEGAFRDAILSRLHHHLMRQSIALPLPLHSHHPCGHSRHAALSMEVHRQRA